MASPETHSGSFAWGYTFQEFESRILQHPVWRLTPPGQAKAGQIELLLQAARVEEAGLLFCRLPVDDPHQEFLRQAGFIVRDELVTFERPLPLAPELPPRVRLAQPDDLEACLEIARTCFVFDRYHQDPHIPDSMADLLKEVWVKNNLAGRSDINLVAVRNNQIVGFNLLLVRNRRAVIDLIGVAPFAQRQGVGRDLVSAAAFHCHLLADNMQAGTQAANLSSFRLYQSLGFAETSRARTWHWSPGGAARSD